MRYCFNHEAITIFPDADRCRTGLADGRDKNPCDVREAMVLPLEGKNVKTVWRVVCAGRHSGRPHTFNMRNEEAALKSQSVWAEAKSETTRKFCLPLTIESRIITDWEQIDDDAVL